MTAALLSITCQCSIRSLNYTVLSSSALCTQPGGQPDHNSYQSIKETSFQHSCITFHHVVVKNMDQISTSSCNKNSAVQGAGPPKWFTKVLPSHNTEQQFMFIPFFIHRTARICTVQALYFCSISSHMQRSISSGWLTFPLAAISVKSEHCRFYLSVDSVACAAVVVITGDWALVAETVATTAGGIVLEVVTGGRDYLKKTEKRSQRENIQKGNSAV